MSLTVTPLTQQYQVIVCVVRRIAIDVVNFKSRIRLALVLRTISAGGVVTNPYTMSYLGPVRVIVTGCV
jgi:hypothetical protein